MDTFSWSVLEAVVFDASSIDETVAAFVTQVHIAGCVHRLAQHLATSEQQCCMVTDGSHFRATVFDGDRRLAFQSNSVAMETDGSRFSGKFTFCI